MMTTDYMTIQNRKHAARLLAIRLDAFKNSDAVVVAIPRGGVPIGYEVARSLNLSFDVIPCKKIKHPSEQHRSIGSVSLDDSYVGESCRNIPQDYIYHQIAMIQHALNAKNRFYDRPDDVDVKGKTVILVDDLLKTGDTVLACIKSLRKRQPKEIILAIPIVTPTAAEQIAQKIDNNVFLVQMEYGQRLDSFYQEFPVVHDNEVKELIAKAKVRQFVH